MVAEGCEETEAGADRSPVGCNEFDSFYLMNPYPVKVAKLKYKTHLINTFLIF
jgi:hypothetical protein